MVGARQRHQQEHRPQWPTERSDPTQHAKGRTGDCPGPREGATTRRNVTRGGGGLPPIGGAPPIPRGDCAIGPAPCFRTEIPSPEAGGHPPAPTPTKQRPGCCAPPPPPSLVARGMACVRPTRRCSFRNVCPPPPSWGGQSSKWPLPRQAWEGSTRAQSQGVGGRQEQIPDPLTAGLSLAPGTLRVKRRGVRHRGPARPRL